MGKLYKNVIIVLNSLEGSRSLFFPFAVDKTFSPILKLAAVVSYISFEENGRHGVAHTLYVYLKNLEEQFFLHLILQKFFTFVIMIPFSNSTLIY